MRLSSQCRSQLRSLYVQWIMVNTESHSHQTAENNWLWIVNINSQAGKWPSSHKRIIIWSIVHHWLRKIVCFSIKISSGRDADWWQGASLPIGERALGIDPQSLRKRPRRKTLKTYWALCHSLMDKMQVEKKNSAGWGNGWTKFRCDFQLYSFLAQQYVLHCNFPTLLCRKAG